MGLQLGTLTLKLFHSLPYGAPESTTKSISFIWLLTQHLCPCPTPAAVHRSKPWHSVMGRQQILNGVGGHCWPGAGPVGWPALRCPFCSLLNDASRWMSREVLCSGVRWHRQWFSGETDGSQRSNSESNSLGKLIPWMQEKCLGHIFKISFQPAFL